MRNYRLRFFKGAEILGEQEIDAADESAARVIASAKCHASEIAYDDAELWEATKRIDWKPPAKSRAAIAEERQRNIVETEIALANTAWARDNLAAEKPKDR